MSSFGPSPHGIPSMPPGVPYGYGSPPGPGYPPSPPLVYGGFWIRVVAYLIDGVILGVINYLVFSVAGIGMMRNADIYGDAGAMAGPALTGTALSLLIPAIYTIGFWTSYGATPGKMPFGLRVVRADSGGPISGGQAVGRFLSYFISSFVFGLGFLWVAFDGRKQGWHDKLAGTVVVRPAGPGAATFG